MCNWAGTCLSRDNNTANVLSTSAVLCFFDSNHICSVSQSLTLLKRTGATGDVLFAQTEVEMVHSFLDFKKRIRFCRVSYGSNIFVYMSIIEGLCKPISHT